MADSAPERSRQNVFRINRLQIKENQRKGPKLEPLPKIDVAPNGAKNWSPH